MASELGRPSRRKNEPGSCRQRTSSLQHRRSAGRSRSSPSGWSRRWWWTESWNRHRGRRPQHHQPAVPGGRSRSAACACQTFHCRLRLNGLDFGTLHRVPPSLIFYLFLHTVLRFGDSLEPQLSSSADVTYLVSTGPLASFLVSTPSFGSLVGLTYWLPACVPFPVSAPYWPIL